MKDKFKCELCNRESKRQRCVAFFFFDESKVIYIPPQGWHVLMCLECYASYLSQVYNMKDKDIKDWLHWSWSLENEEKNYFKNSN